MSDQSKYQISIVFTRELGGISINENHTMRNDDKKEIYKDREELIEKLTRTKTTTYDESDNPVDPPPPYVHKIPICTVHKTPMVSRKGRFGDFWSCPTKLANKTWCKDKGTYTY